MLALLIYASVFGGGLIWVYVTITLLVRVGDLRKRNDGLRNQLDAAIENKRKLLSAYRTPGSPEPDPPAPPLRYCVDCRFKTDGTRLDDGLAVWICHAVPSEKGFKLCGVLNENHDCVHYQEQGE